MMLKVIPKFPLRRRQRIALLLIGLFLLVSCLSLKGISLALRFRTKRFSALKHINDPSSNFIRYRLQEESNAFSSKPRIHFIGSHAGQDLEIPTFPSLAPYIEKINLTVAFKELNKDGHRVQLVKALDGQISYSNRVRDAMKHLHLSHPHLHLARANACIYILCQNQDLGGIIGSIMNFEFVFNAKYQYPYVFLNDEPFTEHFKARVQSLTKASVEFGIIPKEHWSFPDGMDMAEFHEKLDENSKKYIYGGSVSYRFMCRYQSRFFYRHPLLQKYRYVWRVEPNVQFPCMIRYDPLLFMALSKKRYGFTLVADEIKATVPDLWKHTVDYMINKSIPMTSFMHEAFYDILNEDFNGNHFWNNFEIADMEMYRSPLYEGYMDKLEETGGWFLERYGDAPIHSLGAAMLLKPEEIHHFADIAYKHESVGSCPVTKNETVGAEFRDICWCKRDSSTWAEHHWWAHNVITTLAPLNQYSYAPDDFVVL